MKWEDVHAALCRLAHDKAKYDLEEGRWLIEAERLRVWEEIGIGSYVEYCERLLGYSPRTSIERLRVAKALRELPHLRQAVADGAVAWSAARELTRIVTPETESAWIEAVDDRTVHEIEAMTSGHEKGDWPDDPITPAARRCVVRMTVSADTYAALREARNQLELEAGHSLDDDELLRALAERACEPPAAIEPDGTVPARRHQVLITLCTECERGFRQGAGVNIEIDSAALDTARCDAQLLEVPHVGAPERARTEVPPATWRAVWRRDHGQCVVPGCRAAKHLDVHHLTARADGGGHDMTNLVLLCSVHHRLLHDRKLTVTGRAPDQLDFIRLGQQMT